jgi:hypothetical protein
VIKQMSRNTTRFAFRAAAGEIHMLTLGQLLLGRVTVSLERPPRVLRRSPVHKNSSKTVVASRRLGTQVPMVNDAATSIDVGEPDMKWGLDADPAASDSRVSPGSVSEEELPTGPIGRMDAVEVEGVALEVVFLGTVA